MIFVSSIENNGVRMGAPSLGAYNFGLPSSIFLILGGPLEESLQQLLWKFGVSTSNPRPPPFRKNENSAFYIVFNSAIDYNGTESDESRIALPTRESADSEPGEMIWPGSLPNFYLESITSLDPKARPKIWLRKVQGKCLFQENLDCAYGLL